MPMIQRTQVTVEELLDAVAKLDPAEQVLFEQGFKVLRQRRMLLKEKVARCAESYQLSPKQQEQLRKLLDKNKEGLITPEEEKELDVLLEKLDQRNLLLADEIQKLAHQVIHEVIAEQNEQDTSADMDKQGEIS